MQLQKNTICLDMFVYKELIVFRAWGLYVVLANEPALIGTCKIDQFSEQCHWIYIENESLTL